jgi:plasmid stabilization system protein ParE
MLRRVRLHRTFVADVRKQTTWLAENGPDEWARNLMVAIDEVSDRLARLPDVGAIVQQDERLVLRKLIFRRLPYVAWYAYAKPTGDVWLLRLFGAHQDRPAPDPTGWSLR